MLIDGEHERTVSNSVPGSGKFLCLFQTCNEPGRDRLTNFGVPLDEFDHQVHPFPEAKRRGSTKDLVLRKLEKGEVRDVLDVTEGEDKPAY